MSQTQFVETPATDSSHVYEQLAYVTAYDAVNNDDYAFVAYKETDVGAGQWRVRIKGHRTAGAVFEPDMIRGKARECGAQGKPFFTWGFSIDPSEGDHRCVQFRVHQIAGKPSEIEMFLQLRKFGGAADEPQSIRFPWPA